MTEMYPGKFQSGVNRVEGDGWFSAYDAESGKVLWSFFAGEGVNAPHASYMVDGKQYIVVAPGGSEEALCGGDGGKPHVPGLTPLCARVRPPIATSSWYQWPG